MRNLRVRAWDIETKKMSYPTIIGINVENFSWNHDRSWLHNCQDWSGEDGYIQDPILMLYSGLKDKNGMEIYEGDIVVNGLSGTWLIIPLERGSMSLLGVCKRYKDRNFDISALNSNVEVIGNAYQNPELL